ncbi:hypothetical protein KOR34_06420 [Posidoniimonas corsicana]|uniref:Uncharacterized protein n=1 Tax=Posidoniimonas corsicana TaxID=1938618 RepID=A0A5C5VB40_9BACT|nr:hypothetical protein [Posidoniimonas corsicana]TWT35748.1 hypothetical protein KOR34_06420 [Posidoniimonas corsicana]
MNSASVSRFGVAVASVVISCLGAPVSGQFDTVINVPPELVSPFIEIGSSTQLNVAEGGQLAYVDVGTPDGVSANVELNMTGGLIAHGVQAYSGSVVTITGGELRQAGVTAHSGSVVNVSGDAWSVDLQAEHGAVVDITGDAYVGRLTAESGSDVRVNGLYLGVGSTARSGSSVTISGGIIGGLFTAEAGSRVELVGNEFSVNGAEYAGATVSLVSEQDVFSGTLSDGSPFVFSVSALDAINGATLTRMELPSVDPTPIVVDQIISSPIRGLRAGQTLTLRAGGRLPDGFTAVGATVAIEGGEVGDAVEVSGGDLQLAGGVIGKWFSATAGGQVRVSGGTIGLGASVSSGARLLLTGGEVGAGFSAARGSAVSISGGVIGTGFEALRWSSVALSGGEYGEGFRAERDSSVSLVGQEFRLDGAPIEGLGVGRPVVVTSRGGRLTGVLADGSSFGFDLTPEDVLNNKPPVGFDFFSVDSHIALTLISGLPGDYNNDGRVTAADYTLWQDSVGQISPLLNDPHGGVVGDPQLDVWRANYGAVAEGLVPEPRALAFALLASCMVLMGRKS